MPPFRKNWAHTLLYAMITNLGPPSANDKLQWQQIAGLLPSEPWGDTAFEAWGKIQTRAQREGWLNEAADEQEVERVDEVKEEGVEEEVEAKKQKSRAAKRKEVGVGKAKKGFKRQRAMKDVDGEESSDEVLVVERGKKVVDRKIAPLTRSRRRMMKVTIKSNKAASKGEMKVDSDSDSDGNFMERKVIAEKTAAKSGGKVRTKNEAVVLQGIEIPDEFLDDED